MAVYLFHQTSDRWSISICFDGTNDSYFLYWLQKKMYSTVDLLIQDLIESLFVVIHR